MKILIANLKLFYQCRGLWFWYIFSGPVWFVLFYMVTKTTNPSGLIGCFFASFLAGLVTADLQRDVMTKPFSICIPGYINLSKHLIFVIGSAFGLLTAIAFLIALSRFHIQGPVVTSLSFFAVWLMGMMVYLLGVWFVFVAQHTVLFMVPLPVAIFVALIFDARRLVDYMIFSSPVLTIAAGILTCGVAWRSLGDNSRTRKYGGRSLMALGEVWNPVRAGTVQLKKAVDKMSNRNFVVVDYFERFFLARMESYSTSAVNRYLLGALYIILGRIFVGRHYMVALMLISMVPFLGYVDGVSGMDASNYFVFGLVAAVATLIDLLPHRDTLPPIGRTEKYYGAVGLGAVITIMYTIFSGMLVALSILLADILPDITIKGITFPFHAIHVKGLCVLLFLLPVALLVGTVVQKKILALFALLFFCIICTMFLHAWIHPKSAGILASFAPYITLSVISLTVISWTTFALLLRYHCRRQNLVGQGR